MGNFLGIDVGSVSTNLVVLDEGCAVIAKEYLRTQGRPIEAIQEGLRRIKQVLGTERQIAGVGTTGSGRVLASALVGADQIRNEITCHAMAAQQTVPGVRTILEIGGQDSKIILLRDGIVADFAMNTVCAAGTGSFLDQQAARLGIPIEEFGSIAVKAKSPVRIAGRCAVFAESDMIHKQQLGHNIEAILSGLCQALVRNYLNNVGKGKDIQGPIIFQGGVAANIGMRQAFEKALAQTITVPQHYEVMGALGAAILAKNEAGKTTLFRGWSITDQDFASNSFTCDHCANHCEIIEIYQGNTVLARWGGRCPRWEAA